MLLNEQIKQAFAKAKLNAQIFATEFVDEAGEIVKFFENEVHQAQKKPVPKRKPTSRKSRLSVIEEENSSEAKNQGILDELQARFDAFGEKYHKTLDDVKLEFKEVVRQILFPPSDLSEVSPPKIARTSTEIAGPPPTDDNISSEKIKDSLDPLAIAGPSSGRTRGRQRSKSALPPPPSVEYSSDESEVEILSPTNVTRGRKVSIFRGRGKKAVDSLDSLAIAGPSSGRTRGRPRSKSALPPPPSVEYSSDESEVEILSPTNVTRGRKVSKFRGRGKKVVVSPRQLKQVHSAAALSVSEYEEAKKPVSERKTRKRGRTNVSSATTAAAVGATKKNSRKTATSTIAAASDVPVAPQISTGDKYSFWQPLYPIPDDIPAKPCVYELKVHQARRSAFISFCDNLRDRLHAHLNPSVKVQKQVDMFIQRNLSLIEVRYSVFYSLNEAKAEQENALEAFHKAFDCTPVYNNF